MKLRIGFVSNSSSSAFIIDLNDLNMDQLRKITDVFSTRIVDGELRSTYTGSTDNIICFLNDIEVPNEVVKWTNLI